MRGWDELMAWHREHGSLVPELLQPPVSRPRMSAAETELGFELHEDLHVLYALGDGVDVPAVASSHGAIAQIAPRIEFPGLAESSRRYRSLDDQAEASDVDDWPPWNRTWFPVFTIGGGEVLAVDCSSTSGDLVHVHWEEGLADVVAPDLDTWLARTSERLGQTDTEMFRGLTPRILNEDVTSAFFLQPIA